MAACGLYVLIDPFVEDIWLSADFLWDPASVFLSVTACVLLGIGQPITVVMDVSGLFNRERTLSIITAVVNLVVSLALVWYSRCTSWNMSCISDSDYLPHCRIFWRVYKDGCKTICF